MNIRLVRLAGTKSVTRCVGRTVMISLEPVIIVFLIPMMIIFFVFFVFFIIIIIIIISPDSDRLLERAAPCRRPDVSIGVYILSTRINQ